MQLMQLRKSTAWSLIDGSLGITIGFMTFAALVGLFDDGTATENAQKMADNYDVARVFLSVLGMGVVLLIFGWISFSREIDPEGSVMNYTRLLLLPGVALVFAGLGLWLGLGSTVDVGINVTLNHVGDGVTTIGDIFLDVGILIIAIVAIRKNTVTTLVKILLALVALDSILGLGFIVAGMDGSAAEDADFLGWIVFTLATAGIGIQSLLAKES